MHIRDRVVDCLTRGFFRLAKFSFYGGIAVRLSFHSLHACCILSIFRNSLSFFSFFLLRLSYIISPHIMHCRIMAPAAAPGLLNCYAACSHRDRTEASRIASRAWQPTRETRSAILFVSLMSQANSLPLNAAAKNSQPASTPFAWNATLGLPPTIETHEFEFEYEFARILESCYSTKFWTLVNFDFRDPVYELYSILSLSVEVKAWVKSRFHRWLFECTWEKHVAYPS